MRRWRRRKPKHRRATRDVVVKELSPSERIGLMNKWLEWREKEKKRIAERFERKRKHVITNPRPKEKIGGKPKPMEIRFTMASRNKWLCKLKEGRRKKLEIRCGLASTERSFVIREKKFVEKLEKGEADLITPRYPGGDDMKIVCVMAIYERPTITVETIELMKKQTLPLYKILLVGSSDVDKIVAEKTGCEYLHHKNRPLGDKWQAGMEHARQYEPDAILINGSDSWLTTNWCEQSHVFIKDGFDLVGTTEFYSCRIDPYDKIQIVHRAYKSRKDPVGAGRLISKNILDKLNWKWFPPGLYTGLDGNSFKNMRQKFPNARTKYLNKYSALIVMGVKSTNWPTINSFKFVRSDPQFTGMGEIMNPEGWAEEKFPGSLYIFKDLVPTLKINEERNE